MAEYFDPRVLGVTGVLEFIIIVLLFKFSIGSDLPQVFGMKIAAAVVMLPIIYGIVYYNANRG